MPHIQMNRNENNQSILIVDDDEIILDILSKGFEMYGLNVVKADNGLEGWNLFKNKPVKIVLTDISMPG
jgi:YesN/AraC family two-component response regulator